MEGSNLNEACQNRALRHELEHEMTGVAGAIFKQFILVLMVCSFSVMSMAQQQPQQPPIPQGAGPGGMEKGKLNGPRKHLATIIFAGLGGAILGLSTLSFYGRPQEKLANIPIGFAFGVIVGTTYVTYKAATNPSEFYGVTKTEAIPNEFGSANERGLYLSQSGSPDLSLTWNFTF